MKKRILALALAGTTAFSVFGAAMSASAATSTHVWYGNDQYVSYKAPAYEIAVGATSKTVGKDGAYALIDPDYTAKNSGEGYWYSGADGLNKVKEISKIKENYERRAWIANVGIFAADTTWKIAEYLEDNGYLATLGILTSADKGGPSVGYKLGDETYANLEDVVEDILAGKTSINASWNYFLTDDASDNGKFTEYRGTEISADAYDELMSWNAYKAKYVIEDANTTYTGSVKVNGVANSYKDWAFKGVIDDVMDTAVVPSGVIYAYDFYYNNNFLTNAGNVATEWAKGEDAAAKALTDVAKLGAEGAKFGKETGTGYYNKGPRADVIDAWVDFLDELAINADNGYRESEKDFISNYSEMYYGDPVYDSRTGKLVGYDYVDLYNIDQLLHDIYVLNNKAEYSQANTSELVYLMQQYDKYIGEYIDIDEVDTTDWGAMMLSVLEAADEADFKKGSVDYKKYTRAVEDLADAYESATTANMVKAAEQGMYELLTDSTYRANTADKSGLTATMSGLYYNAKKLPATYTVDADVDASTYNGIGNDGNGVYTKFGFISNKQEDMYWTLYPMADYAQQGNSNAVYTGNVGAADYTTTTYYGKNVKAESTDEYQWFWNVYQLAYNMLDGNLYQGSIDAINEVLAEAVEALNVTVTPYATETSALEEMMDNYDGKIESDYNAGYYGMYTKAYDYAESVEGKYQTRIAREIVAASGSSLGFQSTQTTVTANDIKGLKASIADAQTALKAIKESADYNAAQVNALNKAIASAQNLVDLYNGSLHTAPNWYLDRYAEWQQSVDHISYTGRVGDKDQLLKSQLTAAIEGIEAAIDYSEVIMGWSKNDAGKWMYGTDNGYLTNGWNKIGSVWYYFNEDGTAKQSEWLNLDGKWYWFNSNAGAAIGWAKVDGDWYYFGGNNAMKTGWQKVDGNWYYLAGSGKMTTGWVQVDGKWYYMSKESNSLGQMLSNTTVEGYKLGADGAMIEK